MKQLIKRYPALSFLAVISLWNWIYMAGFIALVPIDPVQGPTIAHVALVFLFASPSVLGILMTRALDGWEGLKALFSRAVRWRVNPLWYAAALLICPAVVGLSYVLQGLLGGPSVPIAWGEKLMMAIPIALVASIMEEFGWRGFALPRLCPAPAPAPLQRSGLNPHRGVGVGGLARSDQLPGRSQLRGADHSDDAPAGCGRVADLTDHDVDPQ
jgi:uncharacterized protein